MTLKRSKKIETRKPLSPMSAKRKAKLAAQGVKYPTSTFAADVPKLSTPRQAKRARDTGFDATTVDAILERDGNACGRCGGALWGTRGFDYSIQHRRARGAGGSLAPDTNAPQNGLALCGHGTAGCHGHVESHREEAEDNGWAVPQGGDPLKIPVNHALHGPGTFLHSNGGWGSRPEEASA
jgi:hypothetical protein